METVREGGLLLTACAYVVALLAEVLLVTSSAAAEVVTSFASFGDVIGVPPPLLFHPTIAGFPVDKEKRPMFMLHAISSTQCLHHASSLVPQAVTVGGGVFVRNKVQSKMIDVDIILSFTLTWLPV